MKTILVMLVAIMLTLAGAAQEETSSIVLDLEGVEISPPQFTGVPNYAKSSGNLDLVKKYLKQNIKYPREAVRCNIEGTEVVKFTVTEAGAIKDIRILNTVCPAIDAEMVRVLQSTKGMWQPGLKNGQPASMTQEVTLAFALNKSDATVVKEFQHKAKLNFNKACKLMIADHKIKKAERYFTKAINYMPKHESLYYLRAMCRHELGNVSGAADDLDRFKDITGYTLATEELAFDAVNLKKAEEMMKLPLNE